MGNLLPEFRWCPLDRVRVPLPLNDVTPACTAAFRAEQLLQPFIAQHQYGIGIDHKLCAFVAHATGFEFCRREQVQEILAPIPLDPLLWMGWAEQLTPSWPPRAGALVWLRCAHSSAQSDAIVALSR